MTSLYSYFGLLGIHDIDTPGHSLYQLGLIDSIKENFHEDKFDFYSYYPESVVDNVKIKPYPSTELGNLFTEYQDTLFDDTFVDHGTVIKKIRNQEYHNLYLKARFRNLSTLSKKWRDAKAFELIINEAIVSGYTPDRIIILDTDLSLSDKFFQKYGDLVTVKIPSIDFPGISNRFLNRCIDIHTNNPNKTNLNSVFYGNIDTTNYKSGNSKSDLLPEVFEMVIDHHMSQTNESRFFIISKEKDFIPFNREITYNIPRHDRVGIWDTLEGGRVMLNITKDKYDTQHFIPARIFEAMIFGMIPVSYKFNWLCPAFSFESLYDLSEIYAYLSECDNAGLVQAYQYFVNSYINYVKK